jgi:hypothetical protein
VREFQPREETPAPTPAYEETQSTSPSYERETARELHQQREEAPAPVAAPPSRAGHAPAMPVKMEWPSDLQQVESDPGKINAVQQEAVQERPAPRPKRVRQSSQPPISEPLVQIETDRAESQSGGGGEKTPV